MKKKDKALIFLLLALILIIIICVNIFSKIVKVDNKPANKNTYKDEQYVIKYEKKGKYEPSIVNKEFNRLNENEINSIDIIIDKVMDLINKKEYLELYQMMNVKYKEVFFEDLDKFEEYMNKEYNSNAYKAFSYRIENGACYVLISDEPELKIGNYKEIKISNYTNPTEFILYLDCVERIIDAKDIISTSNLLIRMEYIVEYEDEVKVLFEIINKNKKEVEFIFEGFKMVSTADESKFVMKSPNTITLKENEIEEIEIICSKTRKIFYMPDLTEYMIKENGKTQTYNSLIMYESDGYEE